jgi:integrase
MASVRRKGRSWQAVYSVYADGRRIQRTRNFPSQAAAKRYAAQMELQEQRGIGSVRITLGDFLAGWLEQKRRTIEPNTFAGYERWIGHVRRCHIATLPLDRVTPLGLEEMYRSLLERPARQRRDRFLSPQSVRHIHAVMQNALNDALRHKMIEANPAASAKPPKGQSVKVAVPDPEQVVTLLNDLAQRHPDLLDFGLILVGCGLRRSEGLGLRWQDVDWTGQRITIRQVIIEFDGKWAIRQGTKSQAGQRTIGIAAEMVDALRRQQARVAELRLAIGRHWQDHNLVFPAASGGPQRPASVYRAFASAAKRAHWPEHSSPIHSLRHAAASHALAGGATLAAISKRLGHSSPAVTARIYLTSHAEQDRQASEAMARLTGKRRR